MNKVKKITIITILALFGDISCEGEFEKLPTKKKFYPSCSQCLEVKADKITAINDLRGPLNRLDAVLNKAEKADISTITQYVDGDKGCFLQQATKHERAAVYRRDQEIRTVMDEMARQVEKMTKQLEALIAAS